MAGPGGGGQQSGVGTVDDCHMKENKLLGAFHKRRVNHKPKQPPVRRVCDGRLLSGKRETWRAVVGSSDVLAVTLPETVPVCTDLRCVFPGLTNASPTVAAPEQILGLQ